MIGWVDLSAFYYASAQKNILVGCQGFLGQVESTISDPDRLLASMAAVRCVFHQLATRGVEIPLVKGIVHPQMKILSLITYPHVVPNM